MFTLMFGMAVGGVSTYFYMRFKSAIHVWWNGIERQIETTLNKK